MWMFLWLLFIIFMAILFVMQYLLESEFFKESKNYFKVNIPIKQSCVRILEESKRIVTKEESTIDSKKSIVASVDTYKTNPWRVKIPKLKLDAPIVEGTSAESLRRTVGHFEKTAKWMGNIGLAAHNRGYRCNFFQEITKLRKGDIIIYCTEKGERRYKVMKNAVIKETDWSYLRDTKDNRITLITCEAGKRKYRRCIQAIEVKKDSKKIERKEISFIEKIDKR